jgi:heat shock protein HtpX
MISALRKIEGRGELHAANSAVMEMCIDNPREASPTSLPRILRSIPVDALVKFAGGHDPGRWRWNMTSPAAFPRRSRMAHGATASRSESQGKPFLPDEPPVDLGGGQGGPWGPRRG